MPSLVRRQGDHDPPLGEIPNPHETGDGNYATEHEKRIFRHLLQPDDSYTPEGVYWADLPWGKRFAFSSSVKGSDSQADGKGLWAMIKEDPLSPVSWYFRNAVLPGAGLGLEGYVLFSIGNLEPLFSAVWPTCWGKHATECSKNWIASVTYLEVIGIMVGQVGVGVRQFAQPRV
jgi:hypothetical protein